MLGCSPLFVVVCFVGSQVWVEIAWISIPPPMSNTCVVPALPSLTFVKFGCCVEVRRRYPGYNIMIYSEIVDKCYRIYIISSDLVYKFAAAIIFCKKKGLHCYALHVLSVTIRHCAFLCRECLQLVFYVFWSDIVVSCWSKGNTIGLVIFMAFWHPNFPTSNLFIWSVISIITLHNVYIKAYKIRNKIWPLPECPSPLRMVRPFK